MTALQNLYHYRSFVLVTINSVEYAWQIYKQMKEFLAKPLYESYSYASDDHV